VLLSEKTRQDQKIEVDSLPSPFHSVKAGHSCGVCRGRCLFLFEISPPHDLGLSSGLKWLKFWEL